MRGATLIELLITVGVFTFLVVSLFAITRDGTAQWRSVEEKATVQSGLRMVVRDLNTELRRGSYTSVRIYPKPTDNTNQSYQHGIIFKSAMNDRDNEGTDLLGDTSMFIVNTDAMPPEPSWQRYVLYYVTRPSAAEHLGEQSHNCAFVQNTQTGTLTNDDVCPHKWIVRKDIFLSARVDDVSKMVAPYMIEGKGNEPPSLATYASSTTPTLYGEAASANPPFPSKLHRARVLAQHILAFNIIPIRADGTVATPKPNGALPVDNCIIEFDIKAFKTLEASDRFAIGSGAVDTSRFTIQVDARVAPQNP